MRLVSHWASSGFILPPFMPLSRSTCSSNPAARVWGRYERGCTVPWWRLAVELLLACVGPEAACGWCGGRSAAAAAPSAHLLLEAGGVLHALLSDESHLLLGAPLLGHHVAARGRHLVA